MALSDELKTHVSDENWNKGKRIRVNISDNAKGFQQADITVELLNLDKVIIVKSPSDVADIEEKDVVDVLYGIYDRCVEEAHKRGRKFTFEV